MIDNQTVDVEKHTLIQSVLLHLFPGILVFSFYLIILKPVQEVGFPSIAAFALSAIVVLIPVEIGILIWISKKNKNELGIRSFIPNAKLSLKEYILYSLGVIIVMGGLVALLEPVGLFFEEHLFPFFPDQIKIDFGLSNDYSRTMLLWTYIVGTIVLAIAAPIVEEVYFRGYLLPRVPTLKGFDKLFHSLLFAMYHLWTPWLIVSRTLFMLPLIFVVRKKQNIYIGMIVHCIVNTIDFVVGFLFLVRL